MKKFLSIAGIAAMAMLFMSADEADAQLRRRARDCNSQVIYAGQNVEGMTQTNDVGRVHLPATIGMALRNPYSPQPGYTYSNRGIQSGLINQWNQQEASYRPWHGDYSYWRYDEPTALVVPPTAAYQTSYAWGVGQVKSTPIHHQFGRYDAGMIGGGQGGMFKRTPYWPSSTDQFGVYPVRAPF